MKTLFSLLALAPLAACGAVVQDKQTQPALGIKVEHPILLFTGQTGAAPSTRIRVEPLNFPPDAEFTYNWRQVQDVLSPTAARMDKGKQIAFTTTNAPNTVATFPDWGVYEIRLTVIDTKHKLSAIRNTWVSVWDSRSQLVVNGTADPLGAAPGINPPAFVRNLHPDPGPFVHPRVYCSDKLDLQDGTVKFDGSSPDHRTRLAVQRNQ